MRDDIDQMIEGTLDSSLNEEKICPDCNGSGLVDPTDEDSICPTCVGSGFLL